MADRNERIERRFGEPLGTAPGGVISYSSDYKTADASVFPSRSSFRSYVNGIYMGYKWQCVEFARRWLYVNKGYIFNDVAMAYDIFNLCYVRDLINYQELPLHSFRNGALRRPEVGCLLIWEEGGEFEETGHVAIVTEVFEDKIRIAEQNMDFYQWPEGQDYSREIKAKVGAQGDYWLHCPSQGSTILGWVIQTTDPTHAVVHETPDSKALNIVAHVAKASSHSELPWLNLANDDESAYVDMMGGHFLAAQTTQRLRYYQITAAAKAALESATDELHQMFLHATDYALERPELLRKFGLPDTVLSKIKVSWENRKNQLITSRFDFAMSERGLKVYEYNCDSASCYMEVGKVQGKWFKHFDVKGGYDAGAELTRKLIKAWKVSDIDDVIHVLQDDDAEETYHALYMKSAIEAAGHRCEIVVGVDALRWGENGCIVDALGNQVKWVWKTWAWETAIDELRFDNEQTASRPLNSHNSTPSLSDVLLNNDIMVFEPLWTLIPSNKAILPILWSLFPNHPLLLNTDFALNDELCASGYVVKPIVGRCGANIKLIDHQQQTLAEKAGAFEHREQIYQQLFALPLIEGMYVQVCTFTAQGHYAGAGVRVDPSMIIGKDSDCVALQIDYEEETDT
ncbi:glutathionylspermidine synthase family protein [Alteromonas oceanisediminis]|uniref:glutathionylspermidine synthase family protein n=1 Tax=Alteromonas oceanisediminis TaxID=2836180 RepID=UPI001BDA5D21|nr:glutathionylspermidine synthase family protein [Alteromonas oceanisediminis]MBT0586826.1 glutathionylspermidine synthase family protein [Alteromonas oceanisediminis]